MKKIGFIIIALIVMVACKENTKETTENTEEVAVVEVQSNYQSFGDVIDDKNVVEASVLAEKYGKLSVGDTVDVKFSAKVNSVCQKKGCWMRLEVGDKESFVRFKDYGFFMPKDIAGQDVIVEGRAFVEETSVEDLKHFAEDAGKSQEEIDAITEPALTYSFISNGVLIPEKE